MSVDLINSVKKLIDLGKGDPGRLEYILDMLTNDRILPLSDQKYLENILSLNFEEKGVLETKNDLAVENLQKQVQDLSQKLAILEKKGFEKYIGKKTILFFITVFVGWNALASIISVFFDLFLPDTTIENLFPLNLVEKYLDFSIVEFVFTALIFAWVFIGFIHLVRFIKSRKISNI